MRLNDKTYNLLKWIAQIVLPAAGTLYFALSSIWGLPYGEQIVGTITAVDAFLGALLGLSSAQYNKTSDGVLVIDETNSDTETWRMEFHDDLSNLKEKSQVTFRVDKKGFGSDNSKF